jgi:hypothetical protein
VESRRRLQLLNDQAALAAAKQLLLGRGPLAHGLLARFVSAKAALESRPELAEVDEALQSHVNTLTVTPWVFYTVSDAALMTLEEGRREVHALLRSLSIKVAKHRARRARSALRHLLWEQPRKGHAALFRSLQPERHELRAVRLADGSLSAEPDKVRQRVHAFFHGLLGQTHQSADELPWETCLDPLLLEARGAPDVPLASKFTRGVYDRARCSLATGKAQLPAHRLAQHLL